MVARIARLEGQTPGIEGQQARAHEELLPVLEGMDGFRGLLILGNAGEAALAISLWTNEEAADASSEAVSFLREEMTVEGEQLASVEQYEVMLFEV